MANVYEGLVKIESGGQDQPSLAEPWTQSDDRKSYTFTLRKACEVAERGEAFTAGGRQVQPGAGQVFVGLQPARRRWTSWRRSSS